MSNLKITLLPILLTGIWINISETLRWMLLIKKYWFEHYQELDIIFPNEPINGLIWIIWGFLLAILVFLLSKKFTVFKTTLISWLAAFVMLWVVLGNIGVFPYIILWYVVPLSLIELYIAAVICRRFM